MPTTRSTRCPAAGSARCDGAARRRAGGSRRCASARSDDFVALAVAFKRVKNIAKDVPRHRSGRDRPHRHGHRTPARPAERRLADELRDPRSAGRGCRGARRLSSGVPAGGRLPRVRRSLLHGRARDARRRRVRARRLALVARLRDLILSLADISEIAPESTRPEGDSERRQDLGLLRLAGSKPVARSL